MVVQAKIIELDEKLWDAIDEQSKQKGLDRVKYIRIILQDHVFKKPNKISKIVLQAYTSILLLIILILLLFVFIRS
jgi:hypothetical protein